MNRYFTERSPDFVISTFFPKCVKCLDTKKNVDVHLYDTLIFWQNALTWSKKTQYFVPGLKHSEKNQNT